MIEIELSGIPLRFETAPELFSPAAVDRGTLAMLSQVDFSPEDRVLDLGCGYGVVGILAAKLIGAGHVVLCDVSQQAVECARKNARLNGVPEADIRVSDGYEHIPQHDFTLILSNPPYHTDFSVAKRFIEGGFQRLRVGGRMVLVTKRLEWYKNKLASTFGGVKVREADGYCVFLAEKRESSPRKAEKSAPKLSRKLARKYKKGGKNGNSV